MTREKDNLNISRRSTLKALGSMAGVTAISGFASAGDRKVKRTIPVDTSKHPRVTEAKVKFYEDGAVEHYTSGHQPADAPPVSFAVKVSNAESPEAATAQLVKRKPSDTPDPTGSDSGEQTTKSGSQDSIGTMSSNDTDGSAYIKVLAEKKDTCFCGPEWEISSKQSSEWNDDNGDGCIDDAENLWEWRKAINGSACNSWSFVDGNIWEDDNPCSLDQLREDRFSYDGGANEVVMRHQLTLHADGSNDWEVTRYDDGGNGCLYHKVETG